MWGIVISVAAVSGMGAALALLLVIAERYIANYGECEITINESTDDRKVTVQGGQPLLGALVGQKMFIPSACGGRGTCGLCKLKVKEGAGPVLPTEEPLLSTDERDSGVRLSCQVKVRNDLKIEIPSELFSIREYKATCARIRDLTHDMKEFRFELVDPAKIDYVPGQYIQLLTPVYKDNEETYRAYSISSDPADRSAIELVIRYVPDGICTTWCFKYLKEGDEVRFNGPYGEFRLAKNVVPSVFIAGGSGIAPMKCLLHQMKNEHSGKEVTFYFGANTTKDLALVDEMDRFTKDLSSFKFVPVVARPEPDSGWKGDTGLVTEALARDLKDASGMEAYLCGSPGMIEASIKVLKSKGMPQEKIYYDKFA